MRDSMICPKCQSTNISISKKRPSIREITYYDFKAFRYYGFCHAKITNYTCKNCGHIEMWVSKDELIKIKDFLKECL